MLKIFSSVLLSKATMMIWPKQVLRQSCFTLKGFYVFTSWVISITLFSHFSMAIRNLEMKPVVQFSKSNSSNFIIVIKLKIRKFY